MTSKQLHYTNLRLCSLRYRARLRIFPCNYAWEPRMTAPAIRIAAILGGLTVLKRKVESESDLVEAVKRGLPTASVDRMVHDDLLSKEEVYALIAPKRTWQLRKQQRKPLTAEESEKAARLARIFALALEAFQNPEKAATWLLSATLVI